MSKSLRFHATQHLTAVKLDVTSAASVAAVLAPFDELAALINCAGVIFRNGAEYDIETFQKVIDVNLTGTMRMCVGARARSLPPPAAPSSIQRRCCRFLVARRFLPIPPQRAGWHN